MEIEICKLETLPNSSITTDPAIDDPKYTSLKDIILNSPTHHAANYHEGSSFNSSSISIRNHLVKHAASAYLQSAAIMATRNQNCFVRFWGKFKSKGAFRSLWDVYVKRPLRACFQPIRWFLTYMINGIGNVWRSRIAVN